TVPVPTSGQRLLLEKLPLMLMTLPVVVLTFIAEEAAGALPSHGAFPLYLRIENALVNVFAYLGKAFFPVHLSVFYPQPESRSLWQPLIACFAVAAVTMAVSRWRGTYPYLLTGWLWYVTALLPVSGLVQVGSHVMADRYAYLPLVGIYLAIAWGASDLASYWGWSNRLWFPAFFIVLVLSGLSWRQVQYWRNTEILFRHAAAVTEGNYLAHSNLGAFLLNTGRLEEAQRHFREALRLKPSFQPAMVNLGNTLITLGDREGGMAWYRKVLAEDPHHFQAMRNLADALMLQGRPAEAVGWYRKFLVQNPDDPEVNNNYGVALVLMGKREEGIRYLDTALRLKPDYGKARENLRKLGLDR
ncbi:MAG: tetratricopeptide repeat protein, partial [Syntrophales bacterium]|nr:tetratricopeptide repeat protein [Syntrophales bacterium]